MKITKLAKIVNGRQDGAIFGQYLFSFNECGDCFVYNMEDILKADGNQVEHIANFELGSKEKIVPHSNAVMFGSEYYEEGDEFPLLYSNLYNNYAKCENRMEGTCLCYRLTRNGNEFKAELVQIIEIGFVKDSSLWISPGEKQDVRPYGNFTIDRENKKLYAFTMRDALSSMRYFAFELPKLSDGEVDEEYGIRKVTLNKEDIIEYFDVEYHRYVQGACFHDGKVYSVEGFTNDRENVPAIRIIDVAKKEQILCAKFTDYGMAEEAELIDFYNGVCCYSDHFGNVYKLEF